MTCAGGWWIGLLGAVVGASIGIFATEVRDYRVRLRPRRPPKLPHLWPPQTPPP